MGMILLNII